MKKSPKNTAARDDEAPVADEGASYVVLRKKPILNNGLLENPFQTSTDRTAIASIGRVGTGNILVAMTPVAEQEGEPVVSSYLSIGTGKIIDFHAGSYLSALNIGSQPGQTGTETRFAGTLALNNLKHISIGDRPTVFEMPLEQEEGKTLSVFLESQQNSGNTANLVAPSIKLTEISAAVTGYSERVSISASNSIVLDSISSDFGTHVNTSFRLSANSIDIGAIHILSSGSGNNSNWLYIGLLGESPVAKFGDILPDNDGFQMVAEMDEGTDAVIDLSAVSSMTRLNLSAKVWYDGGSIARGKVDALMNSSSLAEINLTPTFDSIQGNTKLSIKIEVGADLGDARSLNPDATGTPSCLIPAPMNYSPMIGTDLTGNLSIIVPNFIYGDMRSSAGWASISAYLHPFDQAAWDRYESEQGTEEITPTDRDTTFKVEAAGEYNIGLASNEGSEQTVTVYELEVENPEEEQP